ncbi:hypothetical protein Kpol_376p17 [Vanderwaltozyma polyspora DSM 70294]|uniref:Nudix hydrolase domain-containing protein n=1 Tax=Vanderwaltozyma polyspora (strain ATCC 22028 / DSM 70294 / BCRC 21397 / CBS 2163 / NBRC 10782 / NRRL Y-8283 / UCD 57-17) TaxID=436907 RepID=A7TRW7_VANPO|nr:uncharacterized protein Kpol_376p17 [Vanderwaltozyma polyspora DSM 70294]EDO15004.1 hypothetical protein Kpol_376p17 [Vanderwaltozyma polyspora DSM 70294]
MNIARRIGIRSCSGRLVRAMSVVKGKPEEAKLVNVRKVVNTNDCKWIGLEKITYLDPNGVEREWDSAVRTTRNSGGIDGIGIIAILKYPNDKPDEIVLQKQFRPPVEGVCIEMPAGLIDSNESIATAALRELKEETGYIGKIVEESPIMFNDPGFTNTNLSMVTVEVDMTLPENINPVTHLEDNEFIECFTIPLKDFVKEMISLDKQGYKLDARVQAFAQGVSFAQTYKF